MLKYIIGTVLIFLSGCQTSDEDTRLKLNELQLIGSHNSYKIGIEKPLMDLLVAEDSNAIGLDYWHLAPSEQLDMGIRGLELDVLYDPFGGAFARPVGLDILDSLGFGFEPYDTASLLAPGFKVFHIPDIDFRSHCLTFKGCLNDVKEWSYSNSNHIPIIITINPKNSGVQKPGFTNVIPFDKQVLDSLDQEILEVFDKEKLVTPELVKGSYES
ncbi:MAG: Ca2+-dependent phosphoinositide-specific phospholipase C, partial [Bacteroidota bacterium]